MVLPVLSIERLNNQLFGLRLEATNINVVSVGIGARDVERLYATGLAEPMLSDSGVEGVGGEASLAL